MCVNVCVCHKLFVSNFVTFIFLNVGGCNFMSICVYFLVPTCMYLCVSNCVAKMCEAGTQQWSVL